MKKQNVAAAAVFVASATFAAVINAEARNPINKNGDTVLSAEEITTAYANNKVKRQEFFKQLDTDHSGALSAEEVGGKDTLKKLDLDDNGSISETEFMLDMAKGTLDALNKTDSNDDGQIDQKEVQTAAEKRKARRNK